MLPGAMEWLEAFFELSSDRQVGMAAGPLPASSIDRWVDTGRVSKSEEKFFRRAMRRADEEYRKASAEKSEMGGSDTVSDQPLSPDMLRGMGK